MQVKVALEISFKLEQCSYLHFNANNYQEIIVG